jgi:two-component system NtrC family sensor kinase
MEKRLSEKRISALPVNRSINSKKTFFDTMYIALKTKIWLTILTIVLLFTFFTLYYFPKQQGDTLLKNYNTEVQNLARTVALGVKIALNEQNYEGVQTAMEFVKGTPGLIFVSLLQVDTTWEKDHIKFTVDESVFKTYPETRKPDPKMQSNDSIVVKRAPFQTSEMSGAILLGFSTHEIKESQRKVRTTSLIVSAVIFLVGLLIGLWLARNISVPIRSLRDAARRVGKGDLAPVTSHFSSDEIGDLSKEFNVMVGDIATAREELHNSNANLSETNKLLNTTLDDLKATQSQLIQSEKMASLGELTAGIAHEIQNPLNFVNNFSEVNAELIDEMKQEIDKGNIDEVKDLAKTISENEQKILFHGKRADGIVKGMLQHSRSNTGAKELTDINALCEEYLRLAYHGLRAKDKSFNAILRTDFDNSIEKINVTPQDIGRVVLNLITNGFYSVNEKKKQIATAKDQQPFEPMIIVSTKKEGSRIGIHVKDNGLGVPQKVLDKIFQPFFTTKPVGQGTGLGLSLSYDIIKGHGGELTVNTTEGEGAEFIISLPA